VVESEGAEEPGSGGFAGPAGVATGASGCVGAAAPPGVERKRSAMSGGISTTSVAPDGAGADCANEPDTPAMSRQAINPAVLTTLFVRGIRFPSRDDLINQWRGGERCCLLIIIRN
jgi:hypothetical protein